MIAFGGSGPIHALRIARKLRIPRVVCPPGAGVMSAFGLLLSPLAFELLRSRRIGLADVSTNTFADTFQALEREAIRFLPEAVTTSAEVRLQRALDMRYEGQGYEVEVPLPSDRDLASLVPELRARFAAEYARVFSLSFADKPLEIVNWKVEASAAESESDFRLAALAPSPTATTPTRRAYFPEADGFVDCRLYDRLALAPGTRIAGPALIEEPESTCVVGLREAVVVDERFNLVAVIEADA
jgi:N-methylhydantoinase A